MFRPGDSTGTFGGRLCRRRVDYSLTGVASAKFRASINQSDRIKTSWRWSTDTNAFGVSGELFYPTGDYHDGWRIDLVDNAGNDVSATGLE
ncbi:MAG: hypothetical protein R3C05_22380 [Pirellulaceae bacterium]